MFVLQGHVRQVLAIDFAPDGYHVATGACLQDTAQHCCFSYVLPLITGKGRANVPMLSLRAGYSKVVPIPEHKQSAQAVS